MHILVYTIFCLTANLSHAQLSLFDLFSSKPFPAFEKPVINDDMFNKGQHNYAIRATIIQNHQKDMLKYNQQLAEVVAQLATLETAQKELQQTVHHMMQTCSTSDQAACQKLQQKAVDVWQGQFYKKIVTTNEQMKALLCKIKDVSSAIALLELDQQRLKDALDEYVRFTKG